MANRWPPLIESRVGASGSIVVNSAAVTALTGVTLTVVPKLATRALVTMVADCERTAGADSVLLVALYVAVDGGAAAAQAPLIIYRSPAVNHRYTLAQVVTLDMAAGSSYVITMQATSIDLGAGHGTFMVRGTHGGLGLVAMPSQGAAY